MKIARYGIGGASWATSFPLGDLQAEDDWEIQRLPIIQPVGGASGAFDFYGVNDYPIAPMVVKKKLTIRATTYENLEDELDDFRNYMFGRTGSISVANRLWLVDRDSSTPHHYWAKAKCTNLKANESYGKNYLTIPINLSFFCPEGVWYEENEDRLIISSNGNHNKTYRGNVPAAVRIEIVPTSNPVTKVVVTNTSSGMSVTWDDSGGSGVAATKKLIIDSAIYSVTNDGTDAYDKLSIGSGQVAWLMLRYYYNVINVAVTQPGGGGWTMDLYHYATFLF